MITLYDLPLDDGSEFGGLFTTPSTAYDAAGNARHSFLVCGADFDIHEGPTVGTGLRESCIATGPNPLIVLAPHLELLRRHGDWLASHPAAGKFARRQQRRD